MERTDIVQLGGSDIKARRIDYNKIDKLMKDRGIKNNEIAAFAGIRDSMMTFVRNGTRNPSSLALANIAIYLRCTVDELIIKE